MAFKTLLLHIDDHPRCAERTRIAIELAQRFDAHLVGLYAVDAYALPAFAPLTAEHPLVIEEQERLRDNRERAAERFKAQAAQAAVSFEWRVAEEEAARVFPLHTRYADLVIVGQTDPKQAVALVPNDLPELLCLAAGRPILVVPFAGEFRTVGQRVLVAWNASREATRAVTDALPFLERAQHVDVLAINPRQGAHAHGETPGADLALYLARHGVSAEVTTSFAADGAVGEDILSRAADLQSDLIVMGAYGQSRLKELVLGGASRTILDSMTVPVLMSH